MKIDNHLGSFFLWRCRQQPAALAYAFVRDTLDITESLTFAQLETQVRRLSIELERHSKAGDRVLLVYPSGLDFVRAFWACMLTGRIAVPVPAPDPVRFKNHAPRLRAIILDAQVSLVLTNRELLEPAESFREGEGTPGALWIATDRAPDAATQAEPTPADGPARALGPDRVAYLQYTSGSTSTPRGVVITHANVLAQCRSAARGFGVRSATSRLLCWLPHFHDYGLVGGLLLPLIAGVPSFLMSPLSFLRRPLRWLEAIERHGATHTGAPNFAYVACVKALAQQPGWHADLSSLVSSTCGAEPIHPDTPVQFQAACAAHGLRAATFAPAYGMAEAVLCVTATSPGAAAPILSLEGESLARHDVREAAADSTQVRRIVGCGAALEEMKVCIVDPQTLVPCTPDRIGEIWLQGSSVGQGYWGRDQENAETFRARTAGGDGPYLRTGDLGFVRNGQLFVSGRLKDLIIVRGRNHAPQDLEWTVQRSSPLLRAGYGAAFSVPTDEGEALVVVQEVERSAAETDLDALARGIRRSVADEHDLPVHAVVLIRAGTVPRTTSGKIRRQSCRQEYLAGELQILRADVLATQDTAPELPEDFPADLRSIADPVRRLELIQRSLLNLVARFARRRPQEISLEASAVECGLDSLSTFRLLQAVESQLGVALPPARVLGEPCLQGVASVIAELVTRPSAAQLVITPLSSAERQGLLPLSAAQKRMWFWQELAPASALYNVPVALELRGPLDVRGLQDCLLALVQRHEGLRTRWVASEGRQYQRIESMQDWRMHHVVLDRAAPLPPMQQYEALAAQEAGHGFDLTIESAVRATLVTLDEQDHRLLWTLHHSVCDGWSVGMLMDELCLLYEAHFRGLAPQLPPIRLQYLDYAAWESRYLSGGVRERELTYWKQQLADAPSSLALPTDHRRLPQPRYRGATVTFHLAASRLDALRALARRTDTTLFMTVLALWQTLLQRHSGQSTVVTGSVIANRERCEFEGVVGYLANTLALRTDFHEGLTVEALLAQVKATTLGAYEHQHVPFEEVIEALRLPRDPSRMPLIQTFVALQPPAQVRRTLGNVRAARVPLISPVAKFDLSLELQPTDSGLEGSLEYDVDLFEPATVERMVGHLHSLLDSMCADPRQLVARLPLLGNSERQLILGDWNDTARPYALHVGVHTMIERQVERTPSAVAVVMRDDHLRYDELNARANRLATHLRRLGVSPDVRVGVCMDRSIELVVGLLAVLKAGGAFVPMDPELPHDRLAYMLDDTSAAVILTQSHLLDRMPRSRSDAARHLLCLDTLLPELPCADANPACLTGPENLAYVIYTSGSTGRPKGVMVPHRALSNHALWSHETFGISAADRVLQKTTISFDAAISDFFIPLQAGATIVLAPPGEHRDTAYLVRALRDDRITLVVLVPSQLQQLLDEPGLEGCVHLRHVMSGGEALELEMAREFQRRLPGATLGNFYGPSEATIDATHCVAQGDFGASATVPIGRPIANTQCYVLDAQRQPVPAGVVGELYIGGAGLALGYLKLPELTAERFVDHPFAPGQRLYRTGDQVRWLAGGKLEYLGRSDFQVKIRGQRVELGEVEAALNAEAGVRQSVVVANEDRQGNKRLVAYVVAPGIDVSDLKRRLRTTLPESMLPAAIIGLAQLPTLANGKVNRHALPTPELDSPRKEIIPPRTQIERTTWEVWRDVLQIEQFGVTDNFFDLGGHSLLAMQMISRLRKRLGIELPLRSLFDAPSVELLARRIETQATGAARSTVPRAPAGRDAPLTAGQQGVWFADRLQGTSGQYNISHAMRLRGSLDVSELSRALQLLAARHDSLRGSIAESGGVPIQVFMPAAALPLQQFDLSIHAPAAREGLLQERLRAFAHAPFNLERAPLARAALLHMGKDDHVFALTIHHIACDGWSLEILLRDIAVQYNAARARQPSPLPPLPLSWRDVAHWDQARRHEGAFAASRAYWRDRLRGLEPLRLPLDAIPGQSNDEPAPVARTRLAGSLVERIESLASEHHATVFMVLLAALEVLLMRRFGRDDVAVGTPVAGRVRSELEPIVGLLLNTLVLRTDLSGNPSFHRLLDQVRTNAIDAWAHQDLPFEDLVAELAPAREAGQQPFFDVMVNSFGQWNDAPDMVGLQAQPVPLVVAQPKFALTLYLQSRPGAIELGLIARRDRFSPVGLQGFLDQFLSLLQQIAERPALTLSEYSLIAPSARRLLPDPTVALVPPPFVSVLQQFTAWAKNAPSRIAIRCGEQQFDYAELDRKSLAMARALRRSGVRRGDVVALCGPRGFAVVASMLAVLRCGAVFLTLDPNLPALRRRAMLHASGARTLCLIGADPAGDVAATAAEGIRSIVCDAGLDALPTLPSTHAHDGFDDGVAPDDPAYLFFTSGSTGTPKAVLGRHHGLSHFIDWQRACFQVTPEDRVSQLTGLSFDPLLRDVFLPLTTGATLCVPQERDLLDPIAWLARERVSLVHTTPTVMQSWLQCFRPGASLDSLRWLFVAGEPLTDALIGAWRGRTAAKARIVNLYGPTETTMARCFHVVGEHADSGVQPVGAALPHSQALVVSPTGVLCGIGEAGEVAIRTPLRSLGYFGQPEETAHRFRINPWRNDSNDRLYFTGDRGRYRTDGALEILGRLDDQVKIRGVRIEPAEVMAALSRHALVRQCTVLARFDSEGLPMLVAYLVAHDGATRDTAAVRTALAAQLPEAFIPAAFVWLDALPTLSNGKIDRKALPAPSAIAAVAQRLVMPRSPIERALWEIWRAVLRVEGLGVTESFFELGGHSLLATQVHARMRDVLGVELPLRSLFEAPTIAGLAAAAERALNDASEAGRPNLPPIRKQPRDRLLPTSYSQRRMWLVQQFNPETAAYNMPFALRLRGSLNRDIFVASLQRLIARHEAFRTTLVAVEGEPMQRIEAHLSAAVEFVDLRALPAHEREASAARSIQLRAVVPYVLSQGPLHRMTLLQLDEHDQVFFWSIHHSIGDGWSSTILMRELASIYPALLRDEEPALPPSSIDFADYAAWQREVFAGPVLDLQLAYWRKALAGLEPLPLPLDRPRHHTHAGRGSRISATVAPATLARLKAFAAQQGVTPYMALLACFQLLLSRHCGVTDVAVGTPIANRTQMSSEPLVGTLVNTVVMRTDLSGNPGFDELLQRVRETALQAYAHQDLPFEALVEALDVPRRDGSAPLVQVLFNVLNPPAAPIAVEGITYEVFDFDSGTSQFDLALSIETETFGHAQLSFSNELFDASTARRIMAGYLSLLDQVIEAPRARLSSFDLVGAEGRRLLQDWNSTSARFAHADDPSRSLHRLIELQSARTPENIALRSSSGSLTYAELQQRGNQLARRLRSRGISRGALVGLCVERSIDMIVALMAILKAGAAYVPLDPAYPKERLAHMCEDAQLALVVTESEVDTPYWPRDRCLMLDVDKAAVAAQSPAALEPDPRLDAGPRDPAYVIYTSGSTGKPKGVAVAHGAAVNFLASMAREPGLTAADVLVAVTTLSFDIAVLELLLPLTIGAQVLLADRNEAADGRALRTLLESGATLMQATPSTWRMLIDAGWKGSGSFKALTGGESLPADLADQLLTRCGELWNMYGPTETTVWSTCWRVVHPERGISIGKPIANTQVHVLDEHRQCCPIGVSGEIYIGGDGVALGYLNRPELTAERFLPDPFSTTPGARLYRTGDRGRWRHDGLLEHQGRLDHQVKVRGHRIELGEIEANLCKHAAVAQAVVIVREDRPGDVRLVAYMVPKGTIPGPHDLREHLRATLPDYMLPQLFVAVTTMPLLPNGKLNRQALPLPAEAPTGNAAGEMPRTSVELAIAEVWQELLGVTHISLRDNFFDLGGHSLLAVRAVAAIEERLGLRLNARQLVFESLAQLSVGAEPPVRAPKPRKRAKADGGHH